MNSTLTLGGVIAQIFDCESAYQLKTLTRRLRQEYPAQKSLIEAAMDDAAYFLEVSDDPEMQAIGRRRVARLEGVSFRNRLLSDRGGDLAGLELAKEDPTQCCVFLADASQPGRVRFSVFNESGFHSHFAFDDYESALKEAWTMGYRHVVSGALESLFHTPRFQQGMQAAYHIQQLHS